MLKPRRKINQPKINPQDFAQLEKNEFKLLLQNGYTLRMRWNGRTKCRPPRPWRPPSGSSQRPLPVKMPPNPEDWRIWALWSKCGKKEKLKVTTMVSDCTKLCFGMFVFRYFIWCNRSPLLCIFKRECSIHFFRGPGLSALVQDAWLQSIQVKKPLVVLVTILLMIASV